MELEPAAILGRLTVPASPADRPAPSTYNISRLGLAPLTDLDPMPALCIPEDSTPSTPAVPASIPASAPVLSVPVAVVPLPLCQTPPDTLTEDSSPHTSEAAPSVPSFPPAISAISAVSPSAFLSPEHPDRRKTTFRLPAPLLDELRSRALSQHSYQCRLVAEALEFFLHHHPVP